MDVNLLLFGWLLGVILGLTNLFDAKYAVNRCFYIPTPRPRERVRAGAWGEDD